MFIPGSRQDCACYKGCYHWVLVYSFLFRQRSDCTPEGNFTGGINLSNRSCAASVARTVRLRCGLRGAGQQGQSASRYYCCGEPGYLAGFVCFCTLGSYESARTFRFGCCRPSTFCFLRVRSLARAVAHSGGPEKGTMVLCQARTRGGHARVSGILDAAVLR